MSYKKREKMHFYNQNVWAEVWFIVEKRIKIFDTFWGNECVQHFLIATWNESKYCHNSSISAIFCYFSFILIIFVYITFWCDYIKCFIVSRVYDLFSNYNISNWKGRKSFIQSSSLTITWVGGQRSVVALRMCWSSWCLEW